MSTPSAAAAVATSPRGARRVALVIFGLGPGGAERVAAALTALWHRQGWEVSLVTLQSPQRDVYPLDPGVRRVALELAGDSTGTLDGIARAARRIGALRRALTGLDADVIVSFMPQTNVVCLLAMAGTGVPVVACERTDPRRAPLPRHWAWLRRALYPRAAAVVVQTEALAPWARAFCRSVHVIPNFVVGPARAAGSLAPEGPKRLLAVGRLVHAKGFDLLVEAFALVAPSRPDWSLVILGEGPERGRLEALARARGLEARISLPGHAANPFEALLQGQAFALSSRYEGFPNALLEAMSCGLPVVAFDCPCGPAEAIRHGHDGLLVPAGDVRALGDALARLMDSPEERLRLGRDAREVAVTLGPERVLPRWTAVLEQVRRRGPP